MGIVARRVPRLFLALAVLLGNVMCLCNSTAAVAQAAKETAAPAHHCHGGSKSSDHSDPTPDDHEEHDCQHCQGTLVAAATAADGRQIDLALAASLFLDLDRVAGDVGAGLNSQSLFVAVESPPALDPPSLLRLHCALII